MVEPLSGKRPTSSILRRFRLHVLSPLTASCGRVRARATRLFALGENWRRKSRPAAAVKRYRLLVFQYGYFIVLSLVASGLLWGVQTGRGTSTPGGDGPGGKGLKYVDALFLAVSAVTLTGLNTVDLSALNSLQQGILFVLLMLGSIVWVSIGILQIKRARLRKEMKECLMQQQMQQSGEDSDGDIDNGKRLNSECTTVADPASRRSLEVVVEPMRNSEEAFERDHPPMANGDTLTPLEMVEKRIELPIKSSAPITLPSPFPIAMFATATAPIPHSTTLDTLHLEYSAQTLLTYILLAYFLLFQLLGSLGIGWWISVHKPQFPLENGLNPWWMGAFNAVSAFNNSGMSLLDLNMVPFQEDSYVVLTMCLLIMAGNTCFPIFLRMIIYVLHVLCPTHNPFWQSKKQVLKFLLDHPRRCYPYLFSTRETWWLACVVVILNGIDWVAFEVLNIGNPIVENIPLGPRIMDGLFQSLAIRSGGFQIVPMAETRVGLRVLYVGMMYISVFPLVMSLRNVDSQLSTAQTHHPPALYVNEKPHIDEDDAGSDEEKCAQLCSSSSPRTPAGRGESSLRERLYTHLTHPLPPILIAIWVITVLETHSIEKDPVGFSVFNIVFETVSAWGTVGVSTGALGGRTFSFCGEWGGWAKMVLEAVMVGGRGRGVVWHL
ncbi:cation transport protein-domain-containing protein [Kalaharituber pfeilii]|nr:cation transport protein-domain-containing protein [Kalaharituber pfeilii]